MDSGRLEAVTGAVHLDTVRALHQTVVSLRTALEVSKNELKELKEKYEQHSRCVEYSDLIEKLTIENHVLRRRIIGSEFEREHDVQNIKLEITCSPRQDVNSEVVIQTATTDACSAVDVDANIVCLSERLNQIAEQTESTHNTPDQAVCLSERLNQIAEQTESTRNTPDQAVGLSERLNRIAEQTESTHNTPVSPDNALQFPENALVLSPETDTSEFEKDIDEDIEEIEPTSHLSSQKKAGDIPTSFKTRLELLSKFDVRIKVKTLRDGATASSTTSDSDSTIEEKKDPGKDTKQNKTENSFYFKEKRKHFENTEDNSGNIIKLKAFSSENIVMAVPNESEVKSKVDKFDVQVRITSEESLTVKENAERTRRKDTLNLDVDDLSLRSLSEGDNSVFSEGGQTPMEPGGPPMGEREGDNGSDNESEEVDDIELIFTTDESKDMSNLQEDLVSIREAEQWAPSSASTHSTPVLIKFHTLDPDFQPGEHKYIEVDQENSEKVPESPRVKRVSLPNDTDIRNVSFNGKALEPGRGILKSCNNKSDNMLYRKSPSTSARKLDSFDSLTCEYNRGMSFDTTKSSSFEGSSMEILQREESVDSFYKGSHLGHRFSVFAEPDISKCGISEEDLAGNLNIRRNTCPNPFQYRPSTHRGVSRAPGPFKAGALGVGARVRPARDTAAGPRRESGAQTDMSALPPRWGSDGHLAYKSAPPLVPTLPGRSAHRPPDVREGRPHTSTHTHLSAHAHTHAQLHAPVRRTDEARRVLLSDIGFTSMVPELSRSADPVWALAKRAADGGPITTSTNKFLSRGSSYRSQCPSIDRSWMELPPLKRDRFDMPPSRYSMPDVRCPLVDFETDLLLKEADVMLRTSLDDLHEPSYLPEAYAQPAGTPFVPSEPKQLKLGHHVKVIAPNGRIALGRVRYVGYCGATASNARVLVGAEFPQGGGPGGLPRNDGTFAGRRYFLTPPNATALFVPFTKVVMAWQ